MDPCAATRVRASSRSRTTRARSLPGVPLYATAEEVAYAEQLAALDRAEDAAARAEWAAAGFEIDPIDPLWDDLLADLASDEELLARMSGPAHEADLMALASIDPRSLESPHARVDYLQRCDRVAALVASRRAEAVVALAGETSSEAYLPEVHVEHEVATARRTSTYAAGQADRDVPGAGHDVPRVRRGSARRGGLRGALRGAGGADPGGRRPGRAGRDRAPHPGQGDAVDAGAVRWGGREGDRAARPRRRRRGCAGRGSPGGCGCVSSRTAWATSR